MKKDIINTKGTIANVLNANMDVVNAALNSKDLYAAKTSIINLLNDSSLNKNPAVCKAKMAIMKAQNAAHLSSIVAAYLTGCKVS